MYQRCWVGWSVHVWQKTPKRSKRRNLEICHSHCSASLFSGMNTTLMLKSKRVFNLIHQKKRGKKGIITRNNAGNIITKMRKEQKIIKRRGNGLAFIVTFNHTFIKCLFYILYTKLCSLESAINLSVEYERKPEEIHAGKWRTYKLHKDRPQL